MNRAVVFLQNRTHRAGAQTCLARLMRFMRAKGERVALLCSERGWLTEICERDGIPVLIERFPTSRSIGSRIMGNAAFSRRAARTLSMAGIRPAIVHANDHSEGLLGLALAKSTNAASAIFLRSSAMTERDYLKYCCAQYRSVIAVGDELQQRVQSWESGKQIGLVYDGIDASEFLEIRPGSQQAPKRVLVIGNAGEAKGWGDLAAALEALEAKGIALPAFDFTGDTSGKSYQDTLKGLRSECRFLERRDDFRSLVREYDLVINPSRNESFGMAAIEVLAAGVPLMSSRTGVIPQVLTSSKMLFEPRNPGSLAQTLEGVLGRWSEIDFGIEHAQHIIHEKFLIDHTWERLERAYFALLKG